MKTSLAILVTCLALVGRAASQSLAVTVTTNRPGEHFHTLEGNWWISSNICWTASASYAVPEGNWVLEWRYHVNEPTRGTGSNSNTVYGMNFASVAPVFAGPGTNAIVRPVPPSATGFFRLRKV